MSDDINIICLLHEAGLIQDIKTTLSLIPRSYGGRIRRQDVDAVLWRKYKFNKRTTKFFLELLKIDGFVINGNKGIKIHSVIGIRHE